MLRILRKYCQNSILPLLYNFAIFGLWFCSFWLCAAPYQKYFWTKFAQNYFYSIVCAYCAFFLPHNSLKIFAFVKYFLKLSFLREIKGNPEYWERNRTKFVAIGIFLNKWALHIVILYWDYDVAYFVWSS